MLDYEWGNPSSIMLTGAGAGEEPTSQNDPSRHIFDQYSQGCFNETTNPLLNPNDFLHNTNQQQHHFLQNPTQTHTHAHFSSLYDPRAYGGDCGYPPAPLLSLEPVGGPDGGQGGGYVLMPKTEPLGCGMDFTNSRIGLNLGGRTYFSSAEDDFVNRLYRRSRPLDAGLVNAPRCQAEGCNADLTHAKHYHRRHKVCEFHSKAATVITAGLTQRFCQQCSRFHLLQEFDNGKRSCRKRLADHNRRRRKSSQNQANQGQTKAVVLATQNSSSENIARSPADSGAQSSSSVTLAVSPPGISLDCFQPRSYQATTSTSSTSNGSIFFSN